MGADFVAYGGGAMPVAHLAALCSYFVAHEAKCVPTSLKCTLDLPFTAQIAQTTLPY